MGGPTNAGSSSISLEDEDTGKSADIIDTDGYQGLVTVTPGHISTDNSTSKILNAGVSFTGEWENIANFGVIVISVTSDVSSATDGLMVQFSSDGTVGGIISDDEFTLTAGAKKTWSFQAAAAYYRLVYTNGGTNQASFNLQTILKPYYVKPSSHRIQDLIVGDDDAELVKAVLTGQKPDNTFINFQSTAGGNFKISIEEFDTAVSLVMATFNDNLDGRTGLQVASALYGRVDDNLLVPIKVDGSTQDLQVVEHEHAEIHGGDHYYLCNFTSLGNAAVIDFQITTPNTTKWGHITFFVSGTLGVTLGIYEDSSSDDDGTVSIPLNNDRNSINTSGMVVIVDSANPVLGANIYPQSIGAGREGGIISRQREIISKQNTTYIIRMANQSTNANIVNYCFEWYEHTGKN